MSIMGGREIVLEHRTLFRYNDRLYNFQHSFKCFVVVIGTIGGILVVCKQYLQTYWKQSPIVKNVWCVARHVKNIIKRLTLAKILCWTFRQLLLPSSAGMKNAKI